MSDFDKKIGEKISTLNAKNEVCNILNINEHEYEQYIHGCISLSVANAIKIQDFFNVKFFECNVARR